MTNKTQKVKVDEKQRDQMVNNILQAHPEIKRDPLKKYQVVELVTAYLLDSDEFNKKTSEFEKLEKKGKLDPPKKQPTEIISITKKDAPEPEKEPANLVVGDDGIIKSVA
jgi:hypothetical protein